MGIDEIVEKMIRKAIEEGKFEGLSGKGKPLVLRDDPYVDPTWRMAHDLLSQHGYTLDWIEVRRQIDAEIDRARSKVARTWAWVNSNPLDIGTEDEWKRIKKEFIQFIEEMNRRIRDYNLSIPADAFFCPLLDAHAEIERITGRVKN
jgi:hypothetical protein